MAESSECSYRPNDRSEIYDQITHRFHSARVLNLRVTRSLSEDMQQATYLPNLHVAYALLHENWGYKKIFISQKEGVQGVKKVENLCHYGLPTLLFNAIFLHCLSTNITAIGHVRNMHFYKIKVLTQISYDFITHYIVNC